MLNCDLKYVLQKPTKKPLNIVLQETKDQETQVDFDTPNVKQHHNKDGGAEHELGLHRCTSLPGTELMIDMTLDARAERVYTVGCFDLFHHGHVKLLKQMRRFGKKVSDNF